MAKVCKCLKTEKMKIELEGLEELTDIELGEVEKEIEPETSYEGIVVDEFKAETTPCYHIKGTNLYYSKGIIGALTQEQVRKYCRLGVQEIERPKIVERIETFKKAIMHRFHEVNAEKGHILPQAWLTPYLSKNVKQQTFFELAMQQSSPGGGPPLKM